MAPIPGGLNISWKSVVTSKQDKYVVVYIRYDTGRPVNIETREPRVTLQGLYPGAGYEIKVYALSHSLLSEPHISFTAVYPSPIRNLTIERVVDNKVTLSWLPPQESLFTGYVIRSAKTSSSTYFVPSSNCDFVPSGIGPTATTNRAVGRKSPTSQTRLTFWKN